MNNISIFIILIIAVGLLNIDYKIFTVNYNILCVLFIFLLALLLLSNRMENLTMDETNTSLLTAIKRGDSPKIQLKVISHQEVRAPVFGISGIGNNIKFFSEDSFYLTYIKYNNNHALSDIKLANPNTNGYDVGVMKGLGLDNNEWTFKSSGDSDNLYHITIEINNNTFYLTYVNVPSGDSRTIFPDINEKCYDVVLMNNTDYSKNNHGWYLRSKSENTFEIYAEIDSNEFYLYTSALEDGNDCKNDYRYKSSSKNCKNVILVRDIYNGVKKSKEHSQSINPVLWFFEYDNYSESGKKIDRELHISIDNIPDKSKEHVYKNFTINNEQKYFYITHNYKHDVKFWPEYNDNFNPGSEWSTRRLNNSNTYIGVKNKLAITLDTLANIEEKRSQGWACDDYDGNNIVCIKLLDGENPEIGLFDVPPGQNLLTISDKCTVELSSLDINSNRYAMFNKNLSQQTITHKKKHQFALIVFNNIVMVKTINLRLAETPKMHSNTYKIQLYGNGNASDSSAIYEKDFLGANGPVHPFKDINKEVRYAKITLTNDEASVLALSFIGIYGIEKIVDKKCPTIDREKEKQIIRNTFSMKNEQEIANRVKDMEQGIVENTSNKILTFLNNVNSQIEWNNINEMCTKIKIIIGKENNNQPIELALSNIIIMASPTKGNYKYKNYADPKLYKELKISSTNEDPEYHKDNCVNQNILSYCKSGYENNPYIEIEFYEPGIYVNKIIIYNIHENNLNLENNITNSNILPCTIKLLNKYDSTILEGYKSLFNTPIIVYGRLPNVNSSCKIDLSKIQDYGSSKYLRFMADVEGNTSGQKCNYCRLLSDNHSNDKYRIGCSDYYEDVKYESTKLDNNINLNTLFIHKLDDNKENVCYCKDNYINCLVNNPVDGDETTIGFNKNRKFTNLLCNSTDNAETLKKTVNEYYNIDSSNDSYYKVDTGFYNKQLDLLFLFKNQKIGKNNHVIYYILKSNFEKKDDTTKSRFMSTDNSGEYFRNIPEIFTKELKMTMCIDNIVYLFNSNKFIRYNIIGKNIIDREPILISSFFNNYDSEVNECSYFNDIVHFFKGSNVFKYELSKKTQAFRYKSKENINTIFEDINLNSFDCCISIEDDLTNKDKFFITKDSMYINYTEDGNKYRKKLNKLVDWTLDKNFMYSDDIRTSENVKRYIEQTDYSNYNMEYDSVNANNLIINKNTKCNKQYPIYPTLSKRYLINKEKTFEKPDKCNNNNPIPKRNLMIDIMNFGNLSKYLEANVDYKKKKYNINTVKDLVCQLNPNNDSNSKYTVDNIVKESINKTFENPRLIAQFFGFRKKR